MYSVPSRHRIGYQSSFEQSIKIINFIKLKTNGLLIIFLNPNDRFTLISRSSFLWFFFCINDIFYQFSIESIEVGKEVCFLILHNMPNYECLVHTFDVWRFLLTCAECSVPINQKVCRKTLFSFKIEGD